MAVFQAVDVQPFCCPGWIFIVICIICSSFQTSAYQGCARDVRAQDRDISSDESRREVSPKVMRVRGDRGNGRDGSRRDETFMPKLRDRDTCRGETRLSPKTPK